MRLPSQQGYPSSIGSPKKIGRVVSLQASSPALGICAPRGVARITQSARPITLHKVLPDPLENRIGAPRWVDLRSSEPTALPHNCTIACGADLGRHVQHSGPYARKIRVKPSSPPPIATVSFGESQRNKSILWGFPWTIIQHGSFTMS
jgi:hypothetical protein